MTSQVPSTETYPNFEQIEQARGEREGQSWWLEELKNNGKLEFGAGVEAGPIFGAPSHTPISSRAFDLIVEFEVSGRQTYQQRYRRPIWPGGASGVTIGIGYDVGYATEHQLRDDWGGAVPDDMISALVRALGVTGEPAKTLAQELGGVVDVPWKAAHGVHQSKVIPRWTGLVERTLPNTGRLSPDCLGALVSLTYNRGASFAKDGDRYREMRAIKARMQALQFDGIATEIRSMTRLWPDVAGLRSRRTREAGLFEAGLSAKTGVEAAVESAGGQFPQATFKEFSGDSGSYLGGPFKIVHHTTEGRSAEGAFGAYRSNRSDPHFTVDATTVFQHIKTGRAARALRNPPGGVQTNRDSAIQIEVVGFADRPKTRPTLINVARLCRWIEREHGVPRVWPSGLPKTATAEGQDPGDHNRSAHNWDTMGGHYGHSQVPENTHWDPAYTADEVAFLMDFEDGPDVESVIDRFPSILDDDPGAAEAVSTMPDHNDVE